MFSPWQWLYVGTAVIVCAARCPTTADTNAFSVSLPRWAIELNAAQDAAEVHHALKRPENDFVQYHDESLAAWARRYDETDTVYMADDSRTKPTNVFLLVGTKTSVVHGFPRRQAIRQTWANAESMPTEVRVVFLGCEPDLSMHSPLQQQQLRHAIDLEKRVFGDILTSELRHCRDSFAGLSDKLKAFMQWAVTTHPLVAYVMEVDDDVYLRVDRVMELLRRPSTPRTRFYAGNSASSAYRGPAFAVRNPRHKYYISAQIYPMGTLPPFVTGAHFMLSGDLVRFLSRNFLDLHGLGAVDDVTIGLWLFAMLQIKPTFFDAFQTLRMIKSCSDDVISFADLTISALRFIHENVANGRRLCEDFDNSKWLLTARAVVAPNQSSAGKNDVLIKEDDEICVLDWDFQFDRVANRLQIAIRLTLGSVTIAFMYVPSVKLAEEGFCDQAASLLHEKLFLAVGDGLCSYHSHLLLRALDRDAQASPSIAPYLSIARHNLRQLQIHDQTDNATSVRAAPTAFTPIERSFLTVVVSASATSIRTVIECLLVEVNPDQQVLVLNLTEGARVRTRVDVYVASTLDRSDCEDKAHGRAETVLLVEDISSPFVGKPMRTSRSVVLASQSGDPDNHTRALPLLPASRIFADTIKFTPMQLLRPQGDHDPASQPVIHSLSYVKQQPEQQDVIEFLRGVHGILPTDSMPSWPRCASLRRDSDGFCLDEAVENLRGTAFAVIVSHHTDSPQPIDHVSDQFVMAFLAGAIPIYIGSVSVSTPPYQLFNRNAYVDCGSFPSIHHCAARVLQVHASIALYTQMRQEAPITDLRLFDEVFSWHPEVADAMAKRTREDATGAVRMSERLRRLLNEPY